MESEPRPAKSPLALILVAGVFLACGAWALGETVRDLVQGRLRINLYIVQLPIGIGLLAHSAFLRRGALVLLWLGYFGVLLFVVLAATGSPMISTTWLRAEGALPPHYAFPIGLALFLLIRWQHHVLDRPDVVKLFDPEAIARS